jgi:tetratricopeptide (TPR) repeat protein
MAMTPASVHVALVMMVRNAADTLERLVGSIDGVVDEWLVVDVGSADDTPSVVSDLLGHLPGRLEHRRWVDAAHNGTELLAMARDLVQPSHLLLLEPDMTVEVAPGFRDRLAGAGGQRLLVTVRRPLFEIRQPLLLRTGPRWSFEGRGFTRLTSEVPVATEDFDDLLVVHHVDSPDRPVVLDENVAILLAQQTHRPEDAELAFHLALNYRDLGRHADALLAFGQALNLSSTSDVIFYCALQIGDLHHRMGNLAGAAWSYLEAVQVDPLRAEGFHRLGRLLNEQARWQAAKVWLERGAGLTPVRHGLFVETWVESWGLEFELAIARWWTGERNAADAAFADLAERPDVPAPYRQACHQNLALATGQD